MRVYLTIFLLTITCITKANFWSSYECTLRYGIDNGWYASTVDYTNYGNGTYATYSLAVYVEYNRVTVIDFGNGGSVHSGINNEGYYYSGGYLNFEYQYGTMNIVAATTTVTVMQDGSSRYYKIRIE